MLHWIVRHEWKSLVADRTLRAVGLLFLVVVGYGIHNGSAWVRFQARTLDAIAGSEAERHAGMRDVLREMETTGTRPAGVADPGIAASAGSTLSPYAKLPPAALGAFSVGQSDLHPFYVRISTREDARALIKNGEMENPTNLLSGRFDLAFVVVFLFPLVILSLTYNLLSGERESGTLAMVLSQPVPLVSLVLGKVLLRLLLVAGLGIGLAALGASTIGTSGGGSLPWFGLWSLVVLVYALLWFAIALGINALGRGSAWNATALLGIWLALVVVAPALVHVAASALHPVPSRVEMIQAMRVASDEANREGSTLLAQYFQDHPEMAPLAGEPNMNDFWARSYAVQQEISRQTAPVQAHFDGQLARQQALVDRWRFVSPAILAQEALNDVSGSGTIRFIRFREQVERFHGEYTAYFMTRTLRGERLTSADYDAFPVFHFQDESWRTVTSRIGITLLGLILPTLLLFGFGLRGVRRYPIAGN